MKCSAKRLLALLTVLAMALSLLPVFVLAEFEPVQLAEASVSFTSYDAAFEGDCVRFTTETGGNVTVEIVACTPGYYMDVYSDGGWLYGYTGDTAESVTFPVTAGREYEILLCSYDLNLNDFEAGSISYKVTFLSNGESPAEPEDPSLIPGATEETPLVITGSTGSSIAPGQTVWYLYDNYQNMVDNGVYSMMLHTHGSTDYTVIYAGETVPVDESGFVSYEMQDTAKVGQYRFSITNNGEEAKYFTVDVRERPVYVYGNVELKVGRTNVTLDTSYPYTLFEFSPSQTGIYQIRVAQGKVGDWGTSFNPIDNTPNKTNTLIWTCTAVGQSVMVGITGPKSTACTIIRTGDYIPPVEVPWTFYENTYDFSYTLPAGEIVDVDLTDGGEHVAVLGADGFYHYSSAEGPLMVANLANIEINIADAALNGGLRVWLQDENHETIYKIDYNDALKQYHDAGTVPVTAELAMMLQEVGNANGWWIAGGMIFTEEVPTDVSMAWMQLCGYLAEPKGVTLSGSITTGDEGEATIELLAGEEVIATVTASGTYCMENLMDGTYTLKVSKANHVPREYTVTVEDEAVTQDVKIHLIGDIDGNGKVNVGDVSKLNGHLKGSSKLTDEYQLLCANVNGGSLNMGDTAALYGHIKGTKTLY